MSEQRAGNRATPDFVLLDLGGERGVVRIDPELADTLLANLEREQCCLLAYLRVLNRWVPRFAIVPEDRAFFEQEIAWASEITQLNHRLLGAAHRQDGEQTSSRWASEDELNQLVEINNRAVRRITAAEADILGSTTRMTRQLEEPSLVEVMAPPARTSSDFLEAPPVPAQMAHTRPEKPPVPRRAEFGPRCYICGEQCGDEVHRRNVATGADSRISVRRSLRVSGSVPQDMRTVCGDCAEQLDKLRKKEPASTLVWVLRILTALGFVFILLRVL
jgi:predicted nucleic acid-binding Zn ribbon protein